MWVSKRDGSTEKVSFDKVLMRINKLSYNLTINGTEIAQKVCSLIYDGVKTSELDDLASQICSSLVAEHPEYGILASRITISNHHKKTSPSFSETIEIMYRNILISEETYEIVNLHQNKFNTYIDYTRDYLFDYFGFKTLEKAYLIKCNGKIVERPQHMILRVAIGIHGFDLRSVLETYDGISKKYFIHATPTLFNFGTPRPQGSSCFLMHANDDSISGIFDSIKEAALISKYAGGIGLHIHNVRGRNSYIRGTNGLSDGIIPMLRVFNSTAKYVNQSGKRNGSIAIYLEPWHSDIEAFMDMRKNHGNEEERARDLFYALWIPDLFMERVRNNEKWSLMCPDTCKGLSDIYGDEFKELYEEYENKKMFKKQVDAQYIWRKILENQIETGTPYMLYKDAINRKTNQSNLGIIKSSNLCTEICEYTSPDEIAVCNLASLCLPSFVNTDTKEFDFKGLHAYTKVVTKNLNKIIDRNFYPLEKAKTSNFKHRPIGIGVQGLADTFILLRLPFDGPEAKELNRQIFETIYHGSLECSMEITKSRTEFFNNDSLDNLSSESCTFFTRTTDEIEKLKRYPGAYSTYEGSPMSKGIYQFDMWGVKVNDDLWNWTELKVEINKWGVRNSLLVAPMPTASTSQIMGFNECFEPITSNLYKRKTLAGEFIVINKYLLKDLIELNLWNTNMKEEIIINEGMIGNIETIPQYLRDIYKTVWEIKQKVIIDMAVDRGAYICQSQSMNLFLESPEFNKMTMMHFYAWEKGIKTGMYYLRTKPKANTQQFTINPLTKTAYTTNKQNKELCDENNNDDNDDNTHCESCSA